MKKQFLIITITIIAASVAFAFVGNDKGEAGGSSAGMTSVLKNAEDYSELSEKEAAKEYGNRQGKVRISTGSDKYVIADEKDVLMTDSMGNRPSQCNMSFIPKQHLADLRIYDTIEIRYKDLTVYEHFLFYNGNKTFARNGLAFGDLRGAARDHFVDMYEKDPKGFAGSHELLETADAGNGLTLEKYDIKDAVSEYDKRRVPEGFTVGRNHPILPLTVLKDGNAPVWVSEKFRFLGAEKRGEGYIVIHNKGVEYINPENGIMVSHYYCKTFASDFDFDDPSIGSPVISAEMLTDNIVRIEYRNGDVIHFRVRLTKEDCDKNLKSGKANAGASIIWHRGKAKVKSLSWDHNPDTSAEPSYSD